MITEEQVKSAIKGDEKAFEYLMYQCKESLYRTAFAYTKNEHDALDVLQESVYKAYISIDKLKNPKYFKTWLTKILINNAIDFINREKKIISIVDNMKVRSTNSEENRVDEKLDIIRSIDRLEDKHKKVIILKYFQDLTITEIAEVMNCPVGTIKTYLNKALSKLRITMGKEII
ncbi:sigma-70 family RNA polymerase sigma factor [Clostridium sp. YIM B02505]|uniref:Sigma-70 family RNA polymerase sigma factor n=1 Tax=Clostridium yunnanense TaxID=2800325 RepID=A0ABS1EVE4_9CLOT|nr:sigma-70 family RNA polymerase sigma factor [Clostridium yunnanense]MBK1813275.1 sigma-70 family RNA polymerase sigma factor [Clostridium yunnanense]